MIQRLSYLITCAGYDKYYICLRKNYFFFPFFYRKTAVKLPPFKVEDVRLKDEYPNCYKSL